MKLCSKIFTKMILKDQKVFFEKIKTCFQKSKICLYVLIILLTIHSFLLINKAHSSGKTKPKLSTDFWVLFSSLSSG